jgi:sepiapterin reductase
MKTKKILITGAGKGIGRAIALEIAKQAKTLFTFKPHLILVSRTEKDLISLARNLLEYNVSSTIFTGDIAIESNLLNLLSLIEKEFKGVDVLINNAGNGVFKNIGDFTTNDYEHTFNTNVKGMFFLTQKIFKQMKEKKSGDIVFITSTAAKKPYLESAIYCMSKFAQLGFIEVLRLHARPNGIRVINVMPGPTATPMWGELQKTLKNKMISPEDVAKTITLALSLPNQSCVEEILIRPTSGDLQDSPAS